MKFCTRWGVRAVLNGHRHLSYQLRLPSGTVLLAAPSSTLGDELAHDPRPQFERYDFTAKPDARLGRHLPRRHPPAARSDAAAARDGGAARRATSPPT